MWVLVLVVVTGVKQSQLLVPRLKSGLGTGVDKILLATLTATNQYPPLGRSSQNCLICLLTYSLSLLAFLITGLQRKPKS